jgi:transcriptional regulator with XRE-family HTH domain
MIRLTAERVERGWSKARLGRRASLDPSTLAKVEARKVVPYPSQLRRVAKALGWSVQDAPALLEEVAVTPRPGLAETRR